MAWVRLKFCLVFFAARILLLGSLILPRHQKMKISNYHRGNFLCLMSLIDGILERRYIMILRIYINLRKSQHITSCLTLIDLTQSLLVNKVSGRDFSSRANAEYSSCIQIFCGHYKM